MEKQQPLRVLVTAPLGVEDGVTTLMISIQEHLDREKVNLDYVVLHDREEPQEARVRAMGSEKMVVSADEIKFKPLRGLVRLNRMRRMCKKKKIQVYHLNASAPFSLLSALAARLGGVKHITFHSHNGGQSKRGKFLAFCGMFLRPWFPVIVDSMWACSTEAARYSFPKSVIKKGNYRFVPNGIDLEHFRFDPAVREEVRRELGLEDKFIVGHAGRFNHQKNHLFLIDVFAAVKAKEPNAVLLLCGDGEEMEKVRQKVSDMGLTDSVIFYGTCKTMHRMYQAMDTFVMPSRFEGLPVTCVEAEASDLPCVLADTVTGDMVVGENVKYLSLNDATDDWADVILQFRGHARNSDENIKALRERGFDDKKMAADFQQFYLNLKL